MPRKIFLLVGIILILASIGLFLRQKVFVGDAQLSIESSPEATVFINGEQVGTTPYDVKMKPQEVEARLIPFTDGNGLAIYETKVELTEGAQTVINHSFGATDDLSSGFVVSFKKVGEKNASLAVVSSPESAELSVDGQVVDVTPHKVSPVAVGEHAVKVSAVGYSPLEVTLRAVGGYELATFVKLARLPREEKTESGESVELEAKKTVVEIGETPVGFLRVRSEASTASSEVARVEPGKKYPYLEEKEVGGKIWYKIEYLPAGEAGEQNKFGWVSGEYAKKVEESL